MPAVGPESAALVMRAHAKVNLRLRVLGPAGDGFHAVETLLLRLALADHVVIEPGPPGLRLEVEGSASAPADASNLCWRAARRFEAAGGRPLGLTIRLEKEIPAGAGLGGGSADAAAVLTLLDRLHPDALRSSALERIAGEIGNDVPFGLCPTPMALGWERGRRILPLPAPPARPVLLLVPDFSIDTATAYGWLRDARRERSREVGGEVLPPASRLETWAEIERLAGNDFEGVVFAHHPSLADGKRTLLEAGASLALLCGSGSCLFGVFETRRIRDEAADRIAAESGFRPVRTATLS